MYTVFPKNVDNIHDQLMKQKVLIIPDDDSFARVETCRMNLL